jgi:hypothetical protein
VRQWLTTVLAGFPMTQHLVTNRAVRIAGDTATCRSCLFNPMGVPDGDGLMVFFEGGYYRETYRAAETLDTATLPERFGLGRVSK